jgi:diacylglycerol kinase (ATP)
VTASFHETQPEESVAAIVREWLADGGEDRRLVVAAGGDGTIREVIDGLVGSPIPLVIVPTGTANVLARALGIPLQSGEALEAVLSPGSAARGTEGSGTGAVDITSVPLDVMRHDSRHFVLTISVGMTARSVAGTSRTDKRRFGFLAYIWRVVEGVAGAGVREFDVTIDGIRRRLRATDVVVTNGILLQEVPAILGSRESYRDGRLEVHAIHGRSLWDYLTFGVQRLLGVRRGMDRYEVITAAREVRIECLAGTAHVQGDGEVLGPPPVSISVEPRAVRVAVPRE